MYKFSTIVHPILSLIRTCGNAIMSDGRVFTITPYYTITLMGSMRRVNRDCTMVIFGRGRVA